MPGRRVRTALQRAWMKIEFTDTCWLWVGSLTSAGYGKIYDDTRRLSQAHREILERGKTPPGFRSLSHLHPLFQVPTFVPFENGDVFVLGEEPHVYQDGQFIPPPRST